QADVITAMGRVFGVTDRVAGIKRAAAVTPFADGFAVARVLEDMAVVEEPGGRLFGAGAEFGDMTVAVVEEGVGVGAADERAEDHALLVPRHGVAGAVGVGPRRAGRCLHEAVGMDEIIRIE